MKIVHAINVKANWSFEIFMDRKGLYDHFDAMSIGMHGAVDDGIHEYLKVFKMWALIRKPWKDQSRALRDGHEIRPTENGWTLEVDATTHGNAMWKGKPYNYAYALEEGWLSPKYKWLEPIIQRTETDLIYAVEKSIDKLVKSLDEGYTISRLTSTKGKGYTMLRHPAGAIDPITGKKIGGNYFKKLT